MVITSGGKNPINADVAKLADALGLGPCGETLGGSSPLVRTKIDQKANLKNENKYL